ncbi:MAG: putative acyl-CoA dehydrogenase FadE17 [Pseudomonadales bacterium]|nr:putative acyl-CoA dehydrogenase FadE17 [Pseudomonadales bacterium]
MSDPETFRVEVRAWLERNCPASLRAPANAAVSSEDTICWGGRGWVFASEDQRLWLERMAARGWTAPEWPRDYGGGGLDRAEARVLREELARIRARSPLASFGLSMLGPALLRYGSEEQKRRFLPPIVRGEIRWCQGYSEPGAGSDLAGLQTRAEDRGDHFLVNGQKIWTSYADQADWIFCLVRTDATAAKQEGISFLLFDMESPGVSTRPITLISGSSPFCETFFHEVRVPKDQLVGELNRGWEIAKYLLTHEREMISALFGVGSAGQATLAEVARDRIGLRAGRLADPGLRHDIARQAIDAEAFAATLERVVDEAKSGLGTGAASSLLKYYGTELNKRRHELLMAIGGAEALGWEGERFDGGALARGWLRSKGNSIEGGTSEIQLNIIAKRILGLPG